MCGQATGFSLRAGLGGLRQLRGDGRVAGARDPQCRDRDSVEGRARFTAVTGTAVRSQAVAAPTDTAAFTAMSEQHFERSKLVVLGLATKDPRAGNGDWAYERELATRC